MKKNQILTIGAVVLMLGIFIGSLFIKEPPRKHLTIVHVNDTHSHFEPLRSGAEAGLGGIIERAAYIDSVRAADGAENVLLLHAGDFSQGTTYFSELGGNLEIQEINNMGYDVVTLGNHEFDNGIEALGRRLSSLNCPVVCCNYDFSPFEAGQYIKPYVILEKAGLKIGVIGVLCNLKAMVAAEISNRIPEFPVTETVQKYADLLKLEEKCDLVIALTHIGYDSDDPADYIDPMLVGDTRNIDMVVGGHSHTFLTEMKYHKNLDGKEIPIVQDGCWGLYVGQIDVVM